ncbi:MAG: hypothetical protein LQ351_003552 [Letrouitia transgressa]|nr:MAG: hypothetical protein LQ351_003552 [Letrouitia transgressa]
MENTTSLNDGPKTLRILCFGDSLTAGYSDYGYSHYPYAKRLQVPLENFLPLTKISITVAGLSGDRVIAGQYLQRIQHQCIAPEEKSYDWIVVLGGTNDLGWGEEPHQVYEGLKRVWKIALDSGANVLALNILEAQSTAGTIVQRRNLLNQLIAQHTEDRWYHMDISNAVPFFTLNGEMRERIWDDGLHLTKEGYEMMGDAIASKLIELIRTCNKPLNIGKRNTPLSGRSIEVGDWA